MRDFRLSMHLCGMLCWACGGETTMAGPGQGGTWSRVTGETTLAAAAGGGTSSSSSSGGNRAVSWLSIPVSGSGVADTDEAPKTPSYSRSCIQSALRAASASVSGAGGTGGAGGAGEAGASTLGVRDAESSTLAAAGSSGVGVGAADLGLGSGDLTVLVLFDQSGSMSDFWDERTKWQVANDALMNALEPVLDLVTIGTIFFPQPGDCDVAALDSGQQINYLSGRDFRTVWERTKGERGPGGATPLHLAMQLADMSIEKACQSGLLERRFRVVIVTDGMPNCGVDESTLASLPAEWNRLGIETRVMGLPGSQGALNLMDGIASAGGSGKCISLGTPQQMQEEMEAALL